MTKKHKLFLLLIILLGAIFRFYKLNWGDGAYPHPDENTVMSSVLQMSFPSQLHPHLFTYGSFITYLIFFTKLILESFLNFSIFNFQFSLSLHPLLIGRIYSALFSTLTILVVYKLSNQIFKDRQRWSLLTAFLVSTTPGLIQQAHFTTPETYQTFFLFLALYLLVKYLNSTKLILILLTAGSFGLALGSKISSVIIGPIFLLGLIIKHIKHPLPLITTGAVFGLTTILIFVITSPFWITDFSSFKTTIEYENKLANGGIQVFYTRQFIDTIPVLFQLEKIYPFVLGPAMLIIGILGLFGMIYQTIRRPNLVLLLTVTCFLTLFLYNSFLFVKWTRYMTPTLPFFALFVTYFLYQIHQMSKLFSSKIKLPRSFILAVYCLLFTVHFFWSLAFFSIYTRPDSRLTASNWITENLPTNSNLIVEGANTIDVPSSGNYVRNSLFLYNLDESLEDQEKLISGLVKADYFIVQSRRVFLNHQRLPEKFPLVSNFYDQLINNQLGFTKIKEITSYPTVLNLEFPDEQASEETFTVFDHPVLRIYKKEVVLTDAQYRRLLNF